MKPTDDFSDSRRPGGVKGTSASSGQARLVIDVEDRVSIDHGALRFEPLDHDGWSREGIAYGPYARAPGLGLAVAMLNGHNTSQVGTIGESLPRRLGTWLLAGGTSPVPRRVWRWLLVARRRRTLREFRRWFLRGRRQDLPALDENLAVGWFSEAAPEHPPSNGEAFVMHATGAENGELWVRLGQRLAPAVRGVHNVPVLYVILLREKGAAFYVASNVASQGLGLLPDMRPLAVEPFGDQEKLHAGIHQSVLGQIGFRVDSRVYGVQVHEVASARHWYGLAHFADALTGEGELGGSPVQHLSPSSETSDSAAAPGVWQSDRGRFERSASGARARESGLLLARTGSPVGLFHALIETGESPQELGLVFRARGFDDHLVCRVSGKGCALGLREAGQWQLLREDGEVSLRAGATHSFQILDDGRGFTAYLDGVRLFGGRISEARLSDETGVGFWSEAESGSTSVRQCEAHPRQLPVPPELALALPRVPAGKTLRLEDAFRGTPGDLAGHAPAGGERWRRDMGRGRFEILSGGGLRVVGNKSTPNPGRTAYTVPWRNPDFADLAIRVTPPGKERGQGEEGRAGVIFLQDPDNYIIVSTWLHDNYDGSSISSFFCLRGFEELYDAVWSNVGRKVHWGREYELRVAFDGQNFGVSLDEDTVLYRSLTDVCPRAPRLKIRRVGVVANWEWGDDTGSVFHQFLARTE